VRTGFLLPLALVTGCASMQPAPPVAPKVPHEITMHGDRIVDPYFWLREVSDPRVQSYLDAEEAYTTAAMKPLEPLQATLYQEMVARIDQSEVSVPYRKGRYFYYSRLEPGKQYPIYARKEGSPDAPEEIILDVNELAKEQPYMGVRALEVSDDGNLLAFSTDNTGYRRYVLQVKDLRTGRILPDRIERTTSVAWAADNKTLFYVTEDDAKRPYRLWRHRLGQQTDDLIHDETDEGYRIGMWRTRSGEYLLLSSGSMISDEVRYVRADRPDAAWRVIAPRRDNHEYSVDHSAEHFYIRTNDRGRNYRVVSAPISDPSESNWTEVVPHRSAATVIDVEAFARHLVVNEREGGLTQLRVIDLSSGEQHRITWPEPVYAVSATENETFDTDEVRVRYQSFVSPPSIYHYDMSDRRLNLMKQTTVHGYERGRYVSERIFATARDGARVPISLVYERGIDPRGSNPLLLYAYGSYGSSQSPTFAAERLSLLDRGVIYALAHIRGGGEMGEEWHEQGKMMSKKNTFTDYIDAASHLVAERYTSKEKLAAMGLSAGGLLMGAVANMSPELFQSMIVKVPFVDVINTMSDPSIPLVVNEWLEWGDPRIEGEYRYMRSYDPYLNIEKKAYPHMLVKISMNDSQVPYWEGAKYVAMRRAMKTDDNLLLLKVNRAAGHSGASGLYDRLRETAFDYAFILRTLGVVPR
jgi:oligopeptidase B